MDQPTSTPSSVPSQTLTKETEQQIQQQPSTTKKLYFKASATEALHSAILLKARNSNTNGSKTTTTTTSELIRTIPAQPKSGANFQVRILNFIIKLCNIFKLIFYIFI